MANTGELSPDLSIETIIELDTSSLDQEWEIFGAEPQDVTALMAEVRTIFEKPKLRSNDYCNIGRNLKSVEAQLELEDPESPATRLAKARLNRARLETNNRFLHMAEGMVWKYANRITHDPEQARYIVTVGIGTFMRVFEELGNDAGTNPDFIFNKACQRANSDMIDFLRETPINYPTAMPRQALKTAQEINRLSAEEQPYGHLIDDKPEGIKSALLNCVWMESALSIDLPASKSKLGDGITLKDVLVDRTLDYIQDNGVLNSQDYERFYNELPEFLHDARLNDKEKFMIGYFFKVKQLIPEDLAEWYGEITSAEEQPRVLPLSEMLGVDESRIVQILNRALQKMELYKQLTKLENAGFLDEYESKLIHDYLVKRVTKWQPKSQVTGKLLERALAKFTAANPDVFEKLEEKLDADKLRSTSQQLEKAREIFDPHTEKFGKLTKTDVAKSLHAASTFLSLFTSGIDFLDIRQAS